MENRSLYLVEIGGREFRVRAEDENNAIHRALQKGWGADAGYHANSEVRGFGVVTVSAHQQGNPTVRTIVTRRSRMEVSIVEEWEAVGSVRGSCGHRHQTEEAAQRCADHDMKDCQRIPGGNSYSDREAVLLS